MGRRFLSVEISYVHAQHVPWGPCEQTTGQVGLVAEMSGGRREVANSPSARGPGELPHVPVLPGIALSLDRTPQRRGWIVVDVHHGDLGRLHSPGQLTMTWTRVPSSCPHATRDGMNGSRASVTR
ncbi:hypothetical protein SAMN05216268_104178 [Streptomyces yunnanensis]|uniref:Uncharacterized protein n=1 Tax=Streptomyces yunnanensis TaxID=156453 RepID=A0A9X8MQ18_9ACTN|nr:hypothetical protein SAMN05216268_104178 [Streptomyces yunnanensis]